MKKSYVFLKVMLVACLFILSPVIIFAQETEQQQEAVSSDFTPYWFLNLHGGFTQYFGDLNDNDFYQTPESWRLGGGIYFGRKFSPLLGLRTGFLYTGISGSSDEKGGANFTGDLLELNLNSTISFLNLFSRNKYERKVDWYGFGGVGYLFASTTLTDADGTTTELNEDGREGFFAFPLGTGLSIALGPQWDFTLEAGYRIVGTDNLDVYPVSGSNDDSYLFTSVGVTYKLGAGVDLRRMAREFNTIQFVTTPEVLEMHGDSVRVTIVGTVPKNYFHKKAAILFQPVLTYSTGETPLKSINLLGEDIVGDGVRINMKQGGTFTYTDVIPYKPEMAISELVVTPLIFAPRKPVEAGITREKIIETERFVDGPQVKLADGVIVTSTRILHDENVMIADHGYEKETIISQEAIIYFQVNLHNLNWNLPLNRNEDAKKKLADLESFLRQGWDIRDIDINAWASPEGEESFNQGLSERRAQTGLKYTHDLLLKLVRERNSLVKIANVEKDVKYNIYPRGEDWDGFMKAVQASNIPDKNVIINVVNSQPDVKKREQEIRNMTVVYKEIAETILPPLRRVSIQVNAFKPKKTDEQIAELATTDPTQLDEKELLYAATLTEDLDVKLNIYISAMNLFPNSFKGFNNAAAIELKKGNVDKAAEYLQKAFELGSGQPEVLNNMGVKESKMREFRKAETHYSDARRLGANVDYNLGIVMINRGDYSRALNYFGNLTCNHNVALTQFLLGNLSAANQNAKCAPENGLTYYLLAVISARADDKAGVLSNLGKAFDADPTLKDVARNDREFLNYLLSPEFKALVQ